MSQASLSKQTWIIFKRTEIHRMHDVDELCDGAENLAVLLSSKKSEAHHSKDPAEFVDE